MPSAATSSSSGKIRKAFLVSLLRTPSCLPLLPLLLLLLPLAPDRLLDAVLVLRALLLLLPVLFAADATVLGRLCLLALLLCVCCVAALMWLTPLLVLMRPFLVLPALFPALAPMLWLSPPSTSGSLHAKR
jgi:hypothetical protein